MWFTSALIAALPLLSLAAPVAKENGDALPRTDYDAIIIGGGPSGLAALSGLARVRRNVLLVDSGEYRNAATRHLHDLPGNDGQQGAYYRFVARKSIANYGTITMTNGTITKIQPERNNTYFTVTGTYTGDHEITYTARKVILGTGIRDVIPGTPGLRENFGKGIYWCPWCDGHEHADQALGIVGPVTAAPGTLREVTTLNTDVVAFTNGTAANQTLLDATEAGFPRWREYMAAKGAPVDDRVMTSIERLRDGADPSADPSLPTHPEHDLFRVHFASGEPVLRNAFIINVPTEQASSLPADIGAEVVKGKIAVDANKGLVTSVPGVYAIGDANNAGATNIPFALFSGKRTAVYLHVQLERENADALLASLGKNGTSRGISSRSIHEEARDVWDEMNGSPDDVLYAGEFDQERVA
ncbi:FAD-dependent pyridine nucleotide-disulfide oxidoreductase [Cordyceps fumosorosea ARSEF 2679]|uniref:FAD-dependent pyridine nucleotide-disulfide oxidoreductase n=1 Tax=Cordyceps fumosorosea (strain ARSEF 2679) TaxID=1081104 RepID=A0A167NZ24_CORFA|nr:FAD-dependent pyridine nucleotide-disulfide oxidoreductase [Cordyceps fumosorosea ARSEF 2679]OAA56102.1 FAD-dependent pyridine nucleotide-disulfide oxidoreductase [Cordyceps fumosorosea ARSEF 2679]